EVVGGLEGAVAIAQEHADAAFKETCHGHVGPGVAIEVRHRYGVGVADGVADGRAEAPGAGQGAVLQRFEPRPKAGDRPSTPGGGFPDAQPRGGKHDRSPSEIGPRYNEKAIVAGAQTERRGEAGPVRVLLRGWDAPAA